MKTMGGSEGTYMFCHTKMFDVKAESSRVTVPALVCLPSGVHELLRT